jgi:hypothetical protein
VNYDDTPWRQAYRKHHGAIPKGCDVHHIDGDRWNNSPENLVALTLQQHYDVHMEQGDFGACYSIATRMGLTEEELRKLRVELLPPGSDNHWRASTVRRVVGDDKEAITRRLFLEGRLEPRKRRKRSWWR